jgi:predicted transcriptional regulator
VARKVYLAIRIQPELKDKLDELASVEERSVSQICELLLRKGVEAYKREGPKYLRSSQSGTRKPPS